MKLRRILLFVVTSAVLLLGTLAAIVESSARGANASSVTAQSKTATPPPA